MNENRFDPCASHCPVAKAAQLLEGRWTTRIVRDLLGGTKRYSQLLHSLERISPKVLSARLQFLEQQGIVHKTTYPEVPPRTEYYLTARGEKLRPIIEAMAEFGTQL